MNSLFKQLNVFTKPADFDLKGLLREIPGEEGEQLLPEQV